MTYEQILQKLRQVFDARHFTYEELASSLGVTRQCAFNYLNGKHGNDIKALNGTKIMRTDTLLKVCDALGLQVIITIK